VPHRDELEAAHARIDALERELEEARTDADRSRARAEALAGASAKHAAESSSSSEKRNKKEKKKWRKRDRRRESVDASRASAAGWSDRRKYRVGVGVLAALVYGAAAVVSLFSSQADPNPVVLIGPALAMVLGVGGLGVVYRAPGAFGGAMITLLISGMVLFVLGMGTSTVMVSELVPWALLQSVVRVVAALLGVGGGVVVVVAWVPDAASSPVEGD
jgi:hypothetical protein